MNANNTDREVDTNSYKYRDEFCKVSRVFDKGTWIGVVVVNKPNNVWDRKEYLCGFPVSNRPLKEQVSMLDKTTGKTVKPLTAAELNRTKIRNLLWSYIAEDIFPKLFFSEGYTTDEEKAECTEKVRKAWAENFDFDFKSFENALVYVDSSKSPPDKSYAEIKRIVQLEYNKRQKLTTALKKIIKKGKEVKSSPAVDTFKDDVESFLEHENTCKDITY